MITICLAFGAIAQVPLIILALTALGLVTPRMLSKFRRHAMVASILVSALVTPGDVLSMTILMAGPLYALYEASIIVSWVTYRLKQRSAKKAERSIGGAAA
jgi:sec-independent protein translocase protein TatC